MPKSPGEWWIPRAEQTEAGQDARWVPPYFGSSYERLVQGLLGNPSREEGAPADQCSSRRGQMDWIPAPM